MNQSKPLRKCRVCGLEAHTEEDLKSFGKDSDSLYGKQNLCKKCQSEVTKKRYRKDPKLRKKRIASTRRWNLANPERVKINRDRHKWKKMGIDADKARLIYDSSDICAICGKEVKGSHKHLDHNHKTKEIRGVLCHNCNIMIGMSREDVNILKNAIEYLTIHSI